MNWKNPVRAILETFFLPIFFILAFIAAGIGRYFGWLPGTYRAFYWRFRLGKCGENIQMERHIVIHSPREVRIGNNVHIAEFVHIWGGGGIEIGDDVIIAAHAALTSQTHNPDTLCSLMRLEMVALPVRIGNNVWIGSGAIVLPGVTIHSGAVIGAGAVVSLDVPPNTIVTGIPARFLRHRQNIGHEK